MTDDKHGELTVKSAPYYSLSLNRLELIMFFKRLLITSLLAIGSVSAFAGTHSQCKIKSITQGNNKAVMLQLDCVDDSIAACAASNKDKVAITATTDIGKIRVSMAMTAFASNKTVTINTWGACSDEIPGVAEMYSIIVFNP